MTPWIYPEDMSPAAVGDGVTDDWNAIQEAVNACAPWQEVYFSKTYGCSAPIVVDSKGIQASSFAQINAVGAAAAPGAILDCFVFPPQFGNRRVILPKISGFGGNSINLDAGVMDIYCHQIDKFGVGLRLGPGAQDCKVHVHWFTNGTSCVQVTDPTFGSNGTVMQGTVITCMFATTCKYGLDFDGSSACDSNSLTFAAWDSNNVDGAVLWYNRGTAPSPQPCSNWRLRVTDWIGGFTFANPPPAGTTNGLIAKGSFQFCEFENGIFDTDPANWGAFAITLGGGNTFKTASATGFEAAFAANWQAAANSRAAFGAAWYMNTRLCKGKCAPIAAGALVTYYAYTPFLDGNSFGFRAQPVVNPGFELVSIADNSAVNPNEVAITWRALNEISPLSYKGIYDEFDWQMTCGIP